MLQKFKQLVNKQPTKVEPIINTEIINTEIIIAKLDRETIANHYLKGEGIEIGALHNPLKINNGTVKYVDRMSNDDLLEQYPELKTATLINVDIIDNGEELKTIQSKSLDFVIANHFLEHCQNPIGTVINMLRVLKKDGILFMALPDKRFTFDVDRPITTLEHIIKDYEEGAEWSKYDHFKEFFKFTHKIEDQKILEDEVNYYMNIDYSIHYHVWTHIEMLELFLYIKKLVNFNIELSLQNGQEVIFILRAI